MNKNIFAKGLLLLMLLAASSSWAAEPSKASVADNTKVGIEFGFGFPYAWLRKDNKDKDLRDIEASPNISLGLMLGYSFLLSNNMKIGPEIGCNYGFTRRIKTPTTSRSNVSLEEKYIQIPVAVKFCYFEEEDFYLAKSFTLGYEIDIAFSTQYKEYGEDVSDTPQPLGALFFGGGIDFQGFYLVGKFKLPLDMFREDQTSSTKKLDAGRFLSTSLVGFDIGIDIMKWL